MGRRSAGGTTGATWAAERPRRQQLTRQLGRIVPKMARKKAAALMSAMFIVVVFADGASNEVELGVCRSVLQAVLWVTAVMGRVKLVGSRT